MTDVELKRLINKTLQPFLFKIITEELRKDMTEALHLAGVPLAAGDPVHLNVTNGDIVMQLADGREFRFGDVNSRGEI